MATGNQPKSMQEIIQGVALISRTAGFLGRGNASVNDQEEARQLNEVVEKIAAEVGKGFGLEKLEKMAEEVHNASLVYEGAGNGSTSKIPMWLMTKHQVELYMEENK